MDRRNEMVNRRVGAAAAVQPFHFERLDVFRLAVEVNRWFAAAKFPRGRTHLRDQGLRASDSVVCNIAEGITKGGAGGKQTLRTALGEAGECFGTLACVELPGVEEQRDHLRRIGAMLNKMSS
jgi:four helix bundle protein